MVHYPQRPSNISPRHPLTGSLLVRLNYPLASITPLLFPNHVARQFFCVSLCCVASPQRRPPNTINSVGRVSPRSPNSAVRHAAGPAREILSHSSARQPPDFQGRLVYIPPASRPPSCAVQCGEDTFH